MPDGVLARVGFAGYSTTFWDFDGVIKDSVQVKSDAFERLFEPFGRQVSGRVRAHHERNGGMSRFEKLPLYLEWARQPTTAENVARYCDSFSVAVRQAVIDSPWVRGVQDCLEALHARQRCVLLTATPQREIEDILNALRIAHWFREVYGAPTQKQDAIAAVLASWGCPPEAAVLIGDSESDYRAARATGVDFVLRRTELNGALQKTYRGPQCEDFVA